MGMRMPSCRRSSLPVVLAVLALLNGLGCNGPFGLMSGGRLDGEVAPVPADWAVIGDYGTCQLETRPADAYSVNIAYTVLNGQLYINAGDTETQWVQNIDLDPRVRLRVDGVLYELRAERVTDPTEIAKFGKAWTDQSTFRRDPAELSPVWVYRLVERSAEGGA